MKKKMKERILNEALYMKETKETVREIAKYYHVSKSTVHKDLKERLGLIDKTLEQEIKRILLNHKEERHLRGGESTRKKYLLQN